MTQLEILKAAKARIADKKHWCQRTLARTARGRGVHPCDPEAVSWCAVGAIYSVDGGNVLIGLLAEASKSIFGLPVAKVNNDTDKEYAHACIMDIYDHAIGQAQYYGNDPAS